ADATRPTATRGRRQLPVRGGKRGDKEGAGPAGRHGRESDSGAHEQPEHGTCSGEVLSHRAASGVTWRPFRGRPTGRASSLYPAFLALAGLSRAVRQLRCAKVPRDGLRGPRFASSAMHSTLELILILLATAVGVVVLFRQLRLPAL